jgi:hypothetical protein
VHPKLIVIFVVEPFHRRFFDRAVHPLNLAIGPRLVGLGQPVLDVVGFADHVEAHRPRVDGVAVPGLVCELDAVIGQFGMDPIRHGFEQVLQELPSVFLSAVAASWATANSAVRSMPPRQMRDRRLQGTEAIVQWQERMAPECDDHRLLGLVGTVERGSGGPVFISSTVARLRQFASV